MMDADVGQMPGPIAPVEVARELDPVPGHGRLLEIMKPMRQAPIPSAHPRILQGH